MCPKVSLPLARRPGPSQRLGSALPSLFGATDDLPVRLALVLTAFHASIIGLHEPALLVVRSRQVGVAGIARTERVWLGPGAVRWLSV